MDVVESECNESTIKRLLNIRSLAKDPSNHPNMMKDKSVLLYLAFTLDEGNEDSLEAALDSIELLGQNSENRPMILKTFGVVQSLDYIADNSKLDNVIRERAKAIADVIRTTDNVQNNTEEKKVINRNKKIITLHVSGLHDYTRKELEDVLTKKVKGVHSVMVDVEHQRCTVTAYEYLEPKVIATALTECTDMEARLVSKNKFNQEMLISLHDDSNVTNLPELPPYLEDKESPMEAKAVKTFKDIRIAASEWFSVAAGILHGCYYW